MVVSTDITQLKRVEEEVRESRERFAEVADSIPGTVYQRILHPDRHLTYPYIAGRTKELFDIDLDELSADPSLIFDAMHPEDREEWNSALKVSGTKLTRMDHQYRIYSKSGEVRWARTISTPHRAPDGAVVWHGVEVDVTEQKRAEAALRESQAQLLEIAENVPGSVYRRILHRDGTISYSFQSRRAKELFDLDPDAILGDPESFFEAIHPSRQGRLV